MSKTNLMRKIKVSHLNQKGQKIFSREMKTEELVAGGCLLGLEPIGDFFKGLSFTAAAATGQQQKKQE